MKLAFFISNHGFGHVMRQLPVIIELLDRGHEVVIMTGEKQAAIASQYLNNRAEIIIADTDAGLIVKPGTIKLDEMATANRVCNHVGIWPQLIASAPDADNYVVDICPWSLIAAKERGIPSFLMASFTWIEQYEDYVPVDLIDNYRAAFQCADHVLYYELANKPTRDLLGKGTDVGFVCRQFDRKQVNRIKNEHDKPIIFLSLGASNTGLAKGIDVSQLPFDFITTNGMNLIGSNVSKLPLDIKNTNDYVAAADYCIAKAGWSTVSEMMIGGCRFAVFKRPDVQEDTMIIKELVRRGAAIAIDTEDLQDIAAIIERIKEYEKSTEKYKNNYGKIADIVTEMIRE